MNLQNSLLAKTNGVCAQLCFYSILIPVNQYSKYWYTVLPSVFLDFCQIN